VNTQQILGAAANSLEQGRIYDLVQKTVCDCVASRQTAAQNGILIFLNDPVGQQHLQQSRRGNPAGRWDFRAHKRVAGGGRGNRPQEEKLEAALILVLGRTADAVQTRQKILSLRQAWGRLPLGVGEIHIDHLKLPTGATPSARASFWIASKLVGDEIFIWTTTFSPSRRAIISGASVRKNSGSSRGEGSTETW
jgi:hypothetical protein